MRVAFGAIYEVSQGLDQGREGPAAAPAERSQPNDSLALRDATRGGPKSTETPRRKVGNRSGRNADRARSAQKSYRNAQPVDGKRPGSGALDSEFQMHIDRDDEHLCRGQPP